MTILNQLTVNKGIASTATSNKLAKSVLNDYH